MEILAGVSRRDLPRLKRLLEAFALFLPTDETWHLIDEWLDHAPRASSAEGRLAPVLVLAGARLASADALMQRLLPATHEAARPAAAD